MTLPVFLAEDDPILRAQLVEVINEACESHVVATAETEAEAIRWLVSHPHQWDLAVLDLFLREGTGFGVLGQLPKLVDHSRVVVLTNSATSENRSRCLKLGAHAVFDKTAELSAFFDFCRRRSSARADKVPD